MHPQRPLRHVNPDADACNDIGTTRIGAPMTVYPLPVLALAQERLAERPCLVERAETLLLRDGRQVLVRPVRPEDQAALQRFFDKASEDDMRLRFFSQRSVPGHAELACYCERDDERGMTFVAFAVQD